MDSARHKVTDEFLTLKQAAKMLVVDVDTLLEWNDSNILKPTITQSGKIGYKRKQIDKFLAVQNILQGKTVNLAEPQEPLQQKNFPEKHRINDNSQQINADKTPKGPKTKTLPRAKSNKLPLFGIASSLSLIIVILLIVFFSNLNKPNPPLDYNGLTSQKEELNVSSVSESQISNINLSETEAPDLETQNIDKNSLDKTLGDTSINTVKNPLTALYSVIGSGLFSHTDTPNQIPFVPSPELNDKSDISVNGTNGTYITNYNSLGNLTSRPSIKSNETTVSNINGTSTDPLAINLGTKDMIQGDKSPKKVVTPSILLVFLTLALLSVVSTFKKQPAYLQLKTDNTEASFPNIVDDHINERIVEIDQKTDGTVVLYFQGEELRISKPELNSESDQFIERLLEYAPKEVKEINYDILEDKQTNLNAPLSKLVTRLGFVGLKRELFFPRTSKNGVLFRRYLTRQDLDSMNLTTDQISNEFKN